MKQINLGSGETAQQQQKVFLLFFFSFLFASFLSSFVNFSKLVQQGANFGSIVMKSDLRMEGGLMQTNGFSNKK